MEACLVNFNFNTIFSVDFFDKVVCQTNEN